MTNRGTKERKRARRAAPPPLEAALPIGCALALTVYLGICLALLAVTNRLLFLGLSIPGLIVVGYGGVRFLYGVALLVSVRLTWSRRGVRCLLVHSDSPAWEAHIRTDWIERFGNVAVLLNWSERAWWQPTLAVKVFRRFCGEHRNFNPAVVVFRGLRRPYVFRFYYAFREALAGRPQYLHRLETDLFRVLGVSERAV